MMVANAIFQPDPSVTSVLLERIIGAEYSLIRLHCEDAEVLHEQLRQHTMRTGQALYAWTVDDGLRSLREGESLVPGCRHVADALRYIAQSAHFGIYFFSGGVQPMDAAMILLLRQVARLGGERVRRVVLLDAPNTMPPGVEVFDLVWSAGGRPRLRDGRWLR